MSELQEISKKRLGALIRSERERLYGRNAARFIEDLNSLTDIQMSVDSLYKFEQGNTMPSIVQLVCICMTLYGSEWNRMLSIMLISAFNNDYITKHITLKSLTRSEELSFIYAMLARNDIDPSILKSIPADSGGME